MNYIKIYEELSNRLLNIPQSVIERAISKNPWFTQENIRYAIDGICSNMLNPHKVEQWINSFGDTKPPNKKVGVIMAGNLPLVALYDLLSIITIGCKCYYKCSSKDRILMEWVINELQQLGGNEIVIKPLNKSSDIDLIIATGSDNSNRYFQSQYGQIPSLFRGSRFSVAIVDNNCNDKELIALWDDIFIHYGLGCRNVSHLFISHDFDLNRLINLWIKEGKHINFKKYLNNYKFCRAEKIMNGEEFIDCDYFLLQHSQPNIGALSQITYSHYHSKEELNDTLQRYDTKIQCVVGDLNLPRGVNYGEAQQPELWDVADGIDVPSFLISKLS